MMILTLLFGVSIGLAQQSYTEGIITQKVTLSSANEEVNTHFASMGEMLATTYFKGDKSAAFMSNPVAGDSRAVIDMDSMIMRVFMNNPMMGKKYMETSLNLSQEDRDKIKVTPNTKTKTILGYQCNGYNIEAIQQGVETKMEMYVTDKIQVQVQQTATLGDKIQGFPMYMEMHITQMGMDITTTMEVTEIRKEQVPDDKLDMSIPEGYSKM